MKIYTPLFFLYLGLTTSPAIAGLWGLTIHSRANCMNNESISWDATKAHLLHTKSDHYFNGDFQHNVIAEWAETRRSAAVHWREAPPTQSNWQVIGYHWQSIGGWLHKVGGGFTRTTNCSKYDGWWDM